MSDTDTLQRFVFEHADIRGEIVHLSASYQAIMQQHQYPPIIQRLLGEALLAVALLSASIKFKGQLTLQFSGDAPIKLLVAKCDDEMHIRGLAQFDENALPADLEYAFYNGRLVVTIEQDDKVMPYQSIIPLNGRSITSGLELYFAQSEQIPTRIWLTTDHGVAAGMLLQLLPGLDSEERERFWEHAVKIGETITDIELKQLDNLTILHRLYHEEDLRLFDPSPVIFRCHCSRDKMLQAVRLLGETEANDILKHNKEIVVNCEYCNREYAFDKVDIATLFVRH